MISSWHIKLRGGCEGVTHGKQLSLLKAHHSATNHPAAPASKSKACHATCAILSWFCCLQCNFLASSVQTSAAATALPLLSAPSVMHVCPTRASLEKGLWLYASLIRPKQPATCCVVLNWLFNQHNTYLKRGSRLAAK